MTNIGHHNNMMTSHQATEPTAFGVLFYHSWRWKQPVSTSSIQLIQPTKSWVQNHFFQNTSRIFPWARHPAGVSNKQVEYRDGSNPCLQLRNRKELVCCKIHRWQSPVKSKSSLFSEPRPFWVYIWSGTFSICHELNLVISTKPTLTNDQKTKIIILSQSKGASLLNNPFQKLFDTQR